MVVNAGFEVGGLIWVTIITREINILLKYLHI